MNYSNITEENKKTVMSFLKEQWYTLNMVVSGRIIDMTKVDGIVVFEEDEIIGLITYIWEGDICEIISLDSEIEGKGIGTILIDKVCEIARSNGCKEVKVITTNDNVRAMEFYQKKGFRLVEVKFNEVNQSRSIKPEIPLIADNGIEIMHELIFMKSVI